MLQRWACTRREGDYQQTAKTSVKHQSALAGPTNWVWPTCWHAPIMAEQSACECHYGNDMTLERKQSGSAQTNKKGQNPGKQNAQKRKTQRDIHQHKHWSKWLIFCCTTEFKRNEKQHNVWIKYASENWSSKKSEHVHFNQAVFNGVNCGVARKLK